MADRERVIESEDSREPWERHATLIGDEHNADVILYSGGVDTQGADAVIRLSKRPGRRENVLLLLTTRGGSADAAFRLTRALQTHYKKLILYIYGMCKSAGTLVAVGVDEIVLSDYGEFGPLDVQYGKRDELFESTSGLDINQALISLQERTYSFFRESLVDMRLGTRAQISTKLASDLASKLAVGVYSAIYSQIDPVQLGANERAMRIAIRYGERLAHSNLKREALERLATGYPSHSFVIDLTEAKTLFINARAPTESEEKLGECIDHLTRDEADGDAIVVLLNDPEPKDDTPESRASEHPADEGKESPNGAKTPTGESAAEDGNGGSQDRAAPHSTAGATPTVHVARTQRKESVPS
jgi:hypothetical protein